MRVALETFLNEINEKTEVNDQYPVLTSSKAGLYLQSDYFNKQVASKDNVGYKVIRRGQFTYRAMSDTGEFFPNMLECTDIGIVSPAYPVFEISDKSVIVPEYLKYFFKSDSFQHSIAGFAQGSTRTSVKFGKMKTVQINLPSIVEQKEIINVLNKSKDLIQSREQELQKLDELVKARFVELIETNKSNNFLGEFIKPYIAERCGNREYPVLSITKLDGIVFQDEKFKKRIASVDASTYKVVPRGKLVQGIHIDERNFAIQNITEAGIVSPAYKIWTVDNVKAIPEVLAYALRTDYAMLYIRSKFTGSVKRRESITTTDFLNMPINLPDIKTQNMFYEFMNQVDKSKFVKLMI